MEDVSVPVVLVHGIRASRTMFKQQLATFERADIPAIAIDLPGHGSRRGETITLEACIAAINDAVRSFDEPVMLVGHSMGGYLSIEYTANHSEHVAGLVACDCTSHPAGIGLKLYAQVGELADRLPGAGKGLNDLMAAMMLPPQGRMDLAEGGYPTGVMASGIAAVARTRPMESLARITVPTWFVNGTLDHFRINEAEFVAARPGAQLRLIRDAHHVMPLVRPVEFSRVLLEIHDEIVAGLGADTDAEAEALGDKKADARVEAGQVSVAG